MADVVEALTFPPRIEGPDSAFKQAGLSTVSSGRRRACRVPAQVSAKLFTTFGSSAGWWTNGISSRMETIKHALTRRITNTATLQGVLPKIPS
ncbi:uncharacterized protein LOC144017522 isoform X2 [Festucalex cinctus]